MKKHICVIRSFDIQDDLGMILRHSGYDARFYVKRNDGHNPAAGNSIIYAENKYTRYIAADKWNDGDTPWWPEQLIEFMEANGEQYKYHTPSAFSFSLYQTMDTDFRFIPHDGFKYRECRSGLYGGRCEVLQFGIFQAHQYDINSAYPHAATSQKFPDPRRLRYVTPSIENIWKMDGVSRVEFSQSGYLPVLPMRINNRIYYVECDHAYSYEPGSETTYTHTELRHAIENGARIHKITRQYAAPSYLKPFDEFMHYCFEKRQQTNQKIWKVIANSLIGRLAVVDNALARYSPAVSEDHLRAYGKENIGHYGVWCVADPIHTVPNSNPLWSAMVMAYARNRLYDMARQAHTVYMDTDCLFAYYPQSYLQISPGIGGLKYAYGEYEIKGAKLYRKDQDNVTILKMKGVNKQTRTEETFTRARYTSERFMFNDGHTRPYQYEGGSLT